MQNGLLFHEYTRNSDDIQMDGETEGRSKIKDTHNMKCGRVGSWKQSQYH